jgi:rhodanese-related sulfurtransferase
MSTGGPAHVSELKPTETWDHLKHHSDAVLVDVRSKAEWSFVGVPDLSTLGHSVVFVEWASFPGMSPNRRFVDEVEQALDGAIPSTMLFLCRSGVRSLSAADAMSEAFSKKGHDVPCISVSEGFEGDLDARSKRGALNGWKVRGLPWQQS